MHVRSYRPHNEARVPLYCIHQSPSSSVVFTGILKEMGKDRLVAAGDTPGFGESDEPPSAPDIPMYAAAHGDAIDAMKMGEKVDIFGYFTGAKIAVELALQRPQQIRRMILNGAVIYTPEEVRGEQRTYQPDKYEWDGSHLMKWWRHLKNGAPADLPIDLFVRYFAEIQRGGPNSWWGHRAAFEYDLNISLPRLTQKVMIVSTDDPQGEKSQRALHLLKYGSLVHLPYMGQGLLDIHRDEVCQLLRDFFDGD